MVMLKLELKTKIFFVFESNVVYRGDKGTTSNDMKF